VTGSQTEQLSTAAHTIRRVPINEFPSPTRSEPDAPVPPVANRKRGLPLAASAQTTNAPGSAAFDDG
jgi:hypothetical protein